MLAQTSVVWSLPTQISSAIGLGALAVVALYFILRATISKGLFAQMSRNQTFCILMAAMVLFSGMAYAAIFRFTSGPPDLTAEQKKQLMFCDDKADNPLAQLACYNALSFKHLDQVRIKIAMLESRKEGQEGSNQ